VRRAPKAQAAPAGPARHPDQQAVRRVGEPPTTPPALVEPAEPGARAAARKRRKAPGGVPGPVRETLAWTCFAAVLACGVILASGAAVLLALAAGSGLLGLAVAAYVILRVTGARLDHLDDENQR